MEHTPFIHAICIHSDTCIGCSHCMKVCPTEAIRIRNGNASIRPERCIDCGECFRVCPARAIRVNNDGLSITEDQKYRIALVPAVFIGQFSSEYTASQLLDAVKAIGFDEVFEVEQTIDFIKQEYELLSQDKAYARPLISSFCPAIVRLIQVKYPSLTSQIIRLKAPHDIAALYLRKKKAEQGIPEESLSIEYITPCAAKIVAAKAPEGELNSPIDKVINMQTVYNKVAQIIFGNKQEQKSKQVANMTPDSVSWSCSGTEKKYVEGRCLAIDGIENVIEFLEKIESGQIADIDFLEMRVCDQGCAGGILCPGNRFLTIERLEQRQKKLSVLFRKENAYQNPLLDYSTYLSSISGTNSILPRNEMALDKTVSSALLKMERINRLLSYLPGFDCGACGAPTCKSLAEDIVKDNAQISHCVFVQRIMEKNYRLSPDQAFFVIEKIWGKDRLNKYTNQDNHEGKETK